MGYAIGYGKRAVALYRAYARPLDGLTPIPESPFRGRSNTLFASEVDVEVLGGAFLPAYTEGDNSLVVATDSMKNLVLREAAEFDGATLESLLAFLGERFLGRYPQMEGLRLRARELRFDPQLVPGAAGFEASDVLYGRSHDDRGEAELELARASGGAPRVADHRCARVGLELLKLSGSAFTRFVRDDVTTLPERVDRPLFVHLDVGWRYADVADALAPQHARYVASEQVRDLVATVFASFVSESIQHLVHELGQRLLARFPQLREVSFRAENRTRDPHAQAQADERARVYSDPFPAYGTITLTLTRT
jgi:urate oxidase